MSRPFNYSGNVVTLNHSYIPTADSGYEYKLKPPSNDRDDAIDVATAISNVRGSGTVKIEDSVTGLVIDNNGGGKRDDRPINVKAAAIKGNISAEYNKELKIEGGTVIGVEETGYNPYRRDGTIVASGVTGDLEPNGGTITLSKMTVIGKIKK